MDTGTGSSMMKPFAPWDGFWEAWSSMVAAWEVKATAGMLIAAFCSFLDLDERLVWFLCFAVAGDFLCGMADAFRRDRFKCRAVAFGATKIFWYIVYLCIVGLMNRSLSIAMGVRVPLLDLFAAYLVASDCVSITGHLQSMGVPVPPLLKEMARKAKKKTARKIEKIVDGREKDARGDMEEGNGD